jgi:hypothetical protein
LAAAPELGGRKSRKRNRRRRLEQVEQIGCCSTCPGRRCVYGAAVTRRLRAMGIRDKPIAPGSLWQNGVAERLIGSIRRECADHVVALGEGQLRRILQSYARCHNEWRTHRSLNKDALFHRPIESHGAIVSRPILGGLHHHYYRI